MAFSMKFLWSKLMTKIAQTLKDWLFPFHIREEKIEENLLYAFALGIAILSLLGGTNPHNPAFLKSDLATPVLHSDQPVLYSAQPKPMISVTNLEALVYYLGFEIEQDRDALKHLTIEEQNLQAESRVKYRDVMTIRKKGSQEEFKGLKLLSWEIRSLEIKMEDLNSQINKLLQKHENDRREYVDAKHQLDLYRNSSVPLNKGSKENESRAVKSATKRKDLAKERKIADRMYELSHGIPITVCMSSLLVLSVAGVVRFFAGKEKYKVSIYFVTVSTILCMTLSVVARFLLLYFVMEALYLSLFYMICLFIGCSIAEVLYALPP